MFGYSLELGSWCLEFFWDLELGIWDLQPPPLRLLGLLPLRPISSRSTYGRLGRVRTAGRTGPTMKIAQLYFTRKSGQWLKDSLLFVIW